MQKAKTVEKNETEKKGERRTRKSLEKGRKLEVKIYFWEKYYSHHRNTLVIINHYNFLLLIINKLIIYIELSPGRTVSVHLPEYLRCPLPRDPVDHQQTVPANRIPSIK